MSILPIRVFGDPVLTTPADAVTEFDSALRTLVADMMETMIAYHGAGLAANQVGVLRRAFVYNCGGMRGHIINPVWEAVGEDTQTGPEGCLSIPDIQAETTRYARVRVRGADVDGNPVVIEADDILARCIQHETDHLDGVLFLKRLESEIRKPAMRQLRESEWFLDANWEYPPADTAAVAQYRAEVEPVGGVAACPIEVFEDFEGTVER